MRGRKKEANNSEHGYIQLSIFDFLNEEPEVQPQIQEAPKPKVFKSGMKWLLPNGVTLTFYWYQNRNATLWVKKDGIEACLDCFHNWTSKAKGVEYNEITNDSMVSFPALYFQFYDNGKNLNESDNPKHPYEIPWLRDDKYNKLVIEAFGTDYVPATNKAFSGYSYDLRDLVVMKWLNLSGLPSRYYQRVHKGLGIPKGAAQVHTPYDVTMNFGELLRFSKARLMP